MRSIYFFCLAFLITCASAAGGVGIQVSPSQIEITDKTKVYSLVVHNPAADVQLFEVAADNFKDSLSIYPSSFSLEAGERQNVEIHFAGQPGQQSTTLATTLSVVGKPLSEARVQAGAGVKVPITVTLSESTQPNLILWYISGGFICCIVLLILAIRFRIGRKTKTPA